MTIYKAYLLQLNIARSSIIYSILKTIVEVYDLLYNVTQMIALKNLDADSFKEQAEDIFDLLSCYFPVVFTPPANDEYR